VIGRVAQAPLADIRELDAAAGRAALDAVVTQQAQIIAYIDDYKFLLVVTMAVLPLLLFFKRTSKGGSQQPVVTE